MAQVLDASRYLRPCISDPIGNHTGLTQKLLVLHACMHTPPTIGQSGPRVPEVATLAAYALSLPRRAIACSSFDTFNIQGRQLGLSHKVDEILIAARLRCCKAHI